MLELGISILNMVKTVLGLILIVKTIKDYNKDKTQPDMITAIAIILCMQ